MTGDAIRRSWDENAALSQAGFAIDRILEPRAPDTGEVMSVIFVASQ